MRAKMTDIASLCNVSKSLISRVINNDITLKIPDSTRNRILDEIERVGYIPDHNARQLAQKISNVNSKNKITIGYISFTSHKKLGHPYFSHIIEGIIDEIQDCDCQLSTAMSLKQLSDDFYMHQMKNIEKMDGLILLGRIENEVLKNEIRKLAKYIVSMDGEFDDDTDFVGSDFLKTAQLALKHLIDTGYTDIGLLVGPLESRLQGCLEFLRGKGLEPNKDWIVCGEYSADIAYQRVKELLETQKPPRAIMAWNDEMALGCMKALAEKGYKIPEDVAITGHDDINAATYTKVPLTTVRIYKEEIGRLAVQTLLERIKTKRKIIIRLEVAGKLIIRSSCGAKKKTAINRSRI